MGINKAILLGVITRGPWIHRFDEDIVADFILSTRERLIYPSGQQIDREIEHLIRCRGKYAEAVQRYANPGQTLYLEGSIRHRVYTDRNGIQKTTHPIEVSHLVFVSPTSTQVDEILH